ncbi:PA0069 family radical SAM protein [Sphingomonas sp. DT-51]|uniref:PA0069 family radical SAM protein n=1 Tax=Sphingomonas sp. DT-51 TaxID=3396165 RepID=UPI003F1A2DAB
MVGRTIRASRGATHNATSARFNLPMAEADGDWLDTRETIDGSPAPLRTTVTLERARTIITRNQSPDVPFDRSINPYRGCEHGCIYCFARPSHAFHDLSPGLDFETKLFAKPDAAALLRNELSRRDYRCAPIAIGTNTDPYQPIEREWRVTREVIEVLAACDHPLVITTKSDRVVRDLDLLAPMAAKRLVAVAISVTSLDPRVAMTVEPRAPTAARRLAAVARLTAAGVPTYVNMAPVIPAITDGEVEAVVAAAAAAGALGISYIPVRLPWEVAPLFRAWLDEHYPERSAKVMAIVQSLRGGKDNDPRFGARMRGEGPWAELLRTRFRIARARHGFADTRRTLDLRCDLFRAPAGAQGELF